MNTKVRGSVAGKYDTIARAKEGSFVLGQQVETKGYTTAGDGGGAKYLVEALGTPDGDGDHATADISLQLTLQKQNVTVLSYGADPAGVEDSTAAFNSAGGGEVPSGTYDITGAVVGNFYTHGTVVITTGAVDTIHDSNANSDSLASTLSDVAVNAASDPVDLVDRVNIIGTPDTSNVADPAVTDDAAAADTTPSPITSTAESLHRLRNNTTGLLSGISPTTLGTFAATKKHNVAASTEYTASMHGAPLGFVFYNAPAHIQAFDASGEFVSNITSAVYSSNNREVTFTMPAGATKVCFNLRNPTDFSNSNPMDAASLDLCLNRIMVNTGATALPFVEYAPAGFSPTASLFDPTPDDEITVVKQDTFYYIRSKAQQSSTKDVVWRMLVNKAFSRDRVDSRTGVVDSYGVRFIDRTNVDTVAGFNQSTEVQMAGVDESCPVRVNGMFVAGGHGVIGYTANMTTHGKTNVDVGSTWSDGTDTWVLYHVIDADTVHMVRLNTGTTDKWVISSATFGSSTLTHVAGATNTANIVISASAQDQFIPIIRNYLAEMRVDDVAITADGEYTGDRVTLSEVYELLNIGEQQVDLIANVGAGSPDYTAVAIGEQIRFYYEYDWNYLGAMSIRAAHGVKADYTRSLDVDYWGGIQLQRLSLSGDSSGGMQDKVFVYIPEIAPVSGLDFEAVAEVTNNTSEILAPTTSCDDVNDPASHYCLIGKDSSDVVQSGHVFGYSREDGDGVPAVRAAIVNNIYRISSAEKNYPYVIDSSAGDGVAGQTNLITAFRAPFLPTDTDLTIPAVIATMNGATYCYITAHQNLSDKSVSIPVKFNGWPVTVLKGSPNVVVLDEYVSENAINIAVSNSYGDVVLKLG